jgi:hypothetical protein
MRNATAFSLDILDGETSEYAASVIRTARRSWQFFQSSLTHSAFVIDSFGIWHSAFVIDSFGIRH